MSAGLKWGEIPANAVHLCIDMQRLFAEDTPWRTPWMPRVTPVVERLCAHRPDRTCFTRFIPVLRPEDAQGAWRRYWDRWSEMTRQAIDPALIELVPELARFAPPARILDKQFNSAWSGTRLHADLGEAGVDTLIFSGAETDVCVLASVLGAVDRGYRVIVASDAVCSSADQTHDALIDLYHQRYGQQIETAEVCLLYTSPSPRDS